MHRQLENAQAVMQLFDSRYHDWEGKRTHTLTDARLRRRVMTLYPLGSIVTGRSPCALPPAAVSTYYSYGDHSVDPGFTI